MARSDTQASLDVSIVIVNYNVRDFLSQALASLQKACKGLRSEILVVDNASDDGSAEMVRRRFPRVHLISNAANLGFAKANNLALKYTRGKFILFINPDTIVQEDTIRTMVEFLKSRPEAGLAGCKILNPDGSFQSPCRRSFPTPWVAFTKLSGLSALFPSIKLFAQYNLTYLSTEQTYPVDAVSGSFMMARKEVLEQVGGLDESFFMYGEDLDLCYRIRQAGWLIFYVHSTQIIHYKGESTRRSSLDEISTFYEAMHLFVEKHFRSSSLFRFILRVSIVFVSFAAFLKSVLQPLKISALDFLAVNLSLLLAEKIWIGHILQYPHYAYPIVFTIPAISVIWSLYVSGVYTQRRMSISRSLAAVLLAYIFIAALLAFFRTFAFSRMIVLISGALAMVFVPGWRLVFRILGKTATHGRETLFGKRALIVGTEDNAIELQKKLRARVGKGYEVIGFVGTTHERIAEIVNGVPILGSLDNVGKIIREHKISDVIFSPQALSYTQILSVISRSRDQAVSFHLVPTTMEVIVGKASVDSLDDLPLVQIAYNIDKPFHVFTKRLFDILLSGLLLTTVYPIFRLSSLLKGKNMDGFLAGLRDVFRGTMSLVGPRNLGQQPSDGNESLYLGKTGLSGLVQLQPERTFTEEEVEQYNLYYARNQSVLLDLEILIKTWLQYRSRKKNSKKK